MGSSRSVRMRPRVFGGVLGRSMGDILRDLPVEGHDAPHGAHGNLRVAEQTPDATLPRIRMALLEVRDFQHEWQPDFPGGSLGGEALVHQPREVLRFKALNPPIDGRAGDVEDPTDTALGPALIRELDDLDPRLVAVALAVIVTQRQCFLYGRLALLPEPLRSLGMQAVAALVEDNPDDFPILKVVVEGFEPGDLLPHSLRHPAGAVAGSDFEVGGQQPQHAFLAEA